MLTGQPTSNDASSNLPIGGLTGLGAAFGLLLAVLLAGDVGLGLCAGAAVGLLVGLAIDAFRNKQ